MNLGGGGSRGGGAEEAGASGEDDGERCRHVEPGDGETMGHRWKIRWGRWAGGLFGLFWIFLFHSKPTSSLFFFFLEYMVKYTYYIVPPRNTP